MQQSTSEHPNAQLVRQGMDAFNTGNMEAYADLIADDVVWHQIGAPTLEGKQALYEAMAGSGGDYSIKAELHDVVANDDHAVSLVEATATRADGRTLTYRTAEIMHIRDGKLVERWAFAEDTQEIADFFA
jgi:uncharacterized protein (TIGR02246 family)